MPEWLQQNLGTIIVAGILIILFAVLLWSFIRDRRAGKCSCGGSCAGCPGACHCHGASESTPSSEKEDTPPAPGESE